MHSSFFGCSLPLSRSFFSLYFFHFLILLHLLYSFDVQHCTFTLLYVRFVYIMLSKFVSCSRLFVFQFSFRCMLKISQTRFFKERKEKWHKNALKIYENVAISDEQQRAWNRPFNSIQTKGGNFSFRIYWTSYQEYQTANRLFVIFTWDLHSTLVFFSNALTFIFQFKRQCFYFENVDWTCGEWNDKQTRNQDYISGMVYYCWNMHFSRIFFFPHLISLSVTMVAEYH